MSRPSLEVADVFHAQGAQYRHQHQGHLSLAQLKVMSAIERCRSATMGGHSLHCDQCDHDQIAYNSCRNRHCPKCQSSAARRWLHTNQRKLLPIEYYHVVFTLPDAIAQLAFYNKAVMYHLLFQAAANTLSTLAKDPKHLHAQLGVTMVLHTWGSAMTHHPHVHAIVTGGGIGADHAHWQSCRKGFLFPVKVLSRLFRRRFMEGARQLFNKGDLTFFGQMLHLTDRNTFLSWCKAQQHREWVVYAKRPFAGPQAVLAYLSRYTHRVAIANSRLVACTNDTVTFRYKDYRAKGRTKQRVITLSSDEFIRRFLLHVLPTGFHRIRHYGLLNSPAKLRLARALLDAPPPEPCAEAEGTTEDKAAPFTCRQCGHAMTIVAIIPQGYHPRGPPR